MHMVNGATMADQLFAGAIDRDFGEHEKGIHDAVVRCMYAFGQVFDVSEASDYIYGATKKGGVSLYRDFPTVTPPFPHVFLECHNPTGRLGDEKAVRSGGDVPKRFGLAVVSARADAIFGEVEDVPVRPERIEEILEGYRSIEVAEREHGILREEDVNSTTAALMKRRKHRVPLGRGKPNDTESGDSNRFDEFLESRLDVIGDELKAYVTDAYARPETAAFDPGLAMRAGVMDTFFSLLTSRRLRHIYTSETGGSFHADASWLTLELAERYVAGTSRAPHHVVSVYVFLENHGYRGVSPAIGVVTFTVDDSGRLCPSLLKKSSSGLPEAFSFSTPLPVEKYTRIQQESRESLHRAMFGSAMVIASCALTFLNCNNVPLDNVEPRPKDQKKHGRKHKTPLVTKKVLKLFPTQRTRTNGGENERLNDSRKDARALHVVRGHFKRYTTDAPLLGKHVGTYFWRPQVRGNAKRGRVEKDYAFTPEQVAFAAEQTTSAPSSQAKPKPVPPSTGRPKVKSAFVSEKRRPRRNPSETAFLGFGDQELDRILREVS